LVPPHAKRLDPRLRSYAGQALAQADEKLAAATSDDFRRELTACLALVAPTGMTQDDRNEWLKVAWGTLAGIPADLLAMGASVARRWADHPSKIVTTILREVEPIWNQRKADRSRVLDAIAKMEPEPDTEPRCTPEEAERIRKQCGIKYPDDTVTRENYIPVEQRRAPTRAEYLAMGVSADTLDAIEAEEIERKAAKLAAQEMAA
jgi:hypothetical protein